MAYRQRHRGTTTQRGYGSSYVRVLKAERAAWRPGDLCWHCGQPMWHMWMTDRRGNVVRAIHLGHTADRTGYVGMVHAYCNEADGARRRNAMYGQRASLMASARRW